MKVFLGVFLAILGAAAVVWGVVRHRMEQHRMADDTLQKIVRLSQDAEIFSTEVWNELGPSDDLAAWSKRPLLLCGLMESYLARFDGDKAQRAQAAKAVRRFAVNLHVAADKVRERMPKHKEWADRLDQRCEEITRMVWLW